MIAFDLGPLSVRIPLHVQHAFRRALVLVAATVVAANVALALVVGLAALWGHL